MSQEGYKMSQDIRENENEGSSKLKRMRVLDYLMTSLHTQPSSKITNEIGNTTFTVNGRLLIPNARCLTGEVARNGWRYKWSTEAPHPLKKPVRQLTPYLSGTIGEARNVETELTAFHIYVTENMLETILIHTNEEIKTSQYYNFPAKTYAYPLSIIELKAFIGILFLSAAKKYNRNVKNSFLWEASDIFNTIIPGERFEHLSQCLRFNKNTWQNMKKQTDAFFGIQDIWKEFCTKCSEVFRPSRNCIVDELFVDYIGNIEYMVPVPKEPQKSLLKAIVLCDSGNPYIMSGVFHIDENHNHAVLADHVVENLTKPIHGTNINITYGSDCFTSVNLSKKMFQQHKLRTVSTLHKTQPEIPKDVIITENRSLGSTIFLYNIKDELQLCSYYSLTGEMRILLSNIHFESAIKEPKGHPNVVEYYNLMKDSVESIKSIYYKYSCSRASSKRHLAIFYTILDLASVNSLTILNSNRSRCGKPAVHRDDFLLKLALDLIIPYVNERMIEPNTTDSIKNILKYIKDQQQNLNIKSTRYQQNRDAPLLTKLNNIKKPVGSRPVLKSNIKHQQDSLKEFKSVQLNAAELARKWNQMKLMSALNTKHIAPVMPVNFTPPQVSAMHLPISQNFDIRRYYILQLIQALHSSRLYCNQSIIPYYNMNLTDILSTSTWTIQQIQTMQQSTGSVQQTYYPIPLRKY